MSVFASYANYYDLLYRDKDYAGEAAFVAALIGRHGAPGHSVLELGCGTGAHAEVLCRAGFTVHGVDVSPVMVGRARERKAAMRDFGPRLTIQEGDARTLSLGKRFDAVIALFHVLSYQTTNADLLAVLASARDHLEPGGVLIADFWYGPAVLSEKPSSRTKRFEDGPRELIRQADPVLHSDTNVVDVHYRLTLRDQTTAKVDTIEEVHRMRYLFLPELDLALGAAGLRRLAAGAWMSLDAPTLETWSAYIVAAR